MNMVSGAVIDTTTSRTRNTVEDAGKKGSTQKACAISVIVMDIENKGEDSVGAHNRRMIQRCVASFKR